MLKNNQRDDDKIFYILISDFSNAKYNLYTQTFGEETSFAYQFLNFSRVEKAEK
jgi:hypothetical protein